MKYIRKFNESESKCPTCKGSGKVNYEMNMWGEIGTKECEMCDGTGESTVYDLNSKLEKFADDAESEFRDMILKLDLNKKMFDYSELHIDSYWNRYSENKDDVESLSLESRIKKSTTITSDIIKTISEKYYSYEFYYDSNGELTLIVKKLF